MEDKPLVNHLDELRNKLILIVFLFCLFFIIGYSLSTIIIHKITSDLISTENVKLVALTPLEYIYAQLRVAFVLSIVFLSPVLIYELLLFIKPALTKKEKYAVKLIIPSFILLFIAGVVFAYFIFLRIGIFIMANITSKAGIVNMWSIDKFLSIIFTACLGSGLIFESPLLLLLLVKLNIIKTEFLRKQRRYIYVLIFIIAAAVTPGPDVFSCIIVALPLIFLYEATLIVIRIFS